MYSIDNIQSLLDFESNLPLPMFHTKVDLTLTIIEVNALFYSTLGINKEELSSKFADSFQNIVLEKYREELQHLIQSANKEESYTLQIKLQHSEIASKTFILIGQFYQYNDAYYTRNYLVDISKQDASLAHLTKVKYYSEMYASFNEDTYLDYDIHNKTLTLSPTFAQRFELNEVIPNYPEALLQKGLIKEDILKLDEILMPYIANLAKFALENEHKDTESVILEDFDEIKFIEIDEHYVTFYSENKTQTKYTVYLKLLLNKDNVPLRIIGKLNNITKQQVQIDMLKVKAEKDLLTGLYNKITTESLANKLFSEGNPQKDQYILMIIDADNFKNINDTHGHLFGDILLAQLSDHLKEIFRSEDIIGRLGGDEFLVVMKNFSTFNFVHRKARNICLAFNKSFDSGNEKIAISASIGIAYYPHHGTDFTSLYQNADKALYAAKAKGKNNYVVYESDMSLSQSQNRRTTIDCVGNIQKSYKENKFEYIFKLLYNSTDLKSSIQSTLKLLIDDFSFTRGYIIEADENLTIFSKTYEHNIYSDENFQNEWQHLPVADFDYINEALFAHGKVVFKSVEDAPDIFKSTMYNYKVKSTMIFQLRSNGIAYGAIGFDDTKKNSTLSTHEIDELETLCHLLATFIIKTPRPTL